VTFSQLLQSLITDTLDVSIPAFFPELALCGTIVLMLLVRVFDWSRWINCTYVALAGSVAALVLAAPWRHLSAGAADPHLGTPIFTGMLVYDALSVYFRSLLLFFAAIFVVFTRISGIPDREDSADFYTLVLGGTLGMCLMASANHLLMVFLAVEMASVPSFVLAGMLKGRRQSSEAALKYAVFGAGTAGVMLYGISLLAGVLGTAHLPTLAVQLAHVVSDSATFGDRYMVLALGGLMVMVGLAFKLSAVPFHFWCPDVFEGASAEVNAFLSVSSKAAALALLVRVALGVGYVKQSDLERRDIARSAASAPADRHIDSSTTRVSPVPKGDTAPVMLVSAQVSTASSDREKLLDALGPVRSYVCALVALVAAITCTFGNLAAYGQTNIKRLMAYSTIAHAGYLMMPVAAAIQLAGDNATAAEQAVSALCFYVGVYLFMNLGAFAVVAFLRNSMRSEEIADYAGLIQRCPFMVVCLSVIMLSLLGLPPLAGFVAKFTVFASLVDAQLWALLIVGGLNTVVSLFYYVRVVKVMALDPEPEDRLPVAFPPLAALYVAAVTIPVVAMGVWWNELNRWAEAAAASLLS